MNFEISIILISSIFIAGIIAILRYKKIHKSYYPFIYFIWIGCLNELVSFVIIYKGFPNAINNNIYVLFEALLIIYFFKKLKAFKKFNSLLSYIISGLILLWVFENVVQNKIHTVSLFFRISYSFIIVLLSISYINNLITSVRKNIFSNADFLICVGFILYFTYKILVEAFWLYGLNSSTRFQSLVYNIMVYLNLICNLIYILAIIWMPRRQIFTMPS